MLTFIKNVHEIDSKEKLRELRRKNKLTQNELAIKLNVSNGTIAMWETNRRQPDIMTIKSIASFFNVSIDYLVGRESDKNVVGVQFNRSVVKIPVYGTIPAGVPIDMIEDSFIEEFEEIPSNWFVGGNEYFALKVRGNSMMPKFEDGDILILKKQDDCENGVFCAVSINHTECTFKKVLKKNNGITLMPLNPEFEPLFFTNQEVLELPVTILGVVKEVRRSY